jgi:hypothetical protein
MASLPAHSRSRWLRSHFEALRQGGLASVLCLSGSLACSGPGGASLGQLEQGLSGARRERGETGALALVTVTQEQVELCTVTLLTPNLVATARHCVAPTSADSVLCADDPGAFSAPYPARRLWVNHADALSGSLGSYGLLPITGGSDEFVAVANVYVPDTPRVCGGDLALLVLERELEPGEATPFAPRLDAPVEAGEPYTAVGFGDTPSPSEQGARRSRADLQVQCAGVDCDPGAGVEASEFLGGDGVCSGDSGGPALDAAGRVLGVASRSKDCTRSVYSSLSSFREFIREVAVRAARAGSYDDPEWLVAPPPEPATEAPAEPEPAAPPEAEAGDGASEPGADDVALQPAPSGVGSSAGGSGCSIRGIGGVEQRTPLRSLLAVGLGLLALQRARRRSAPSARGRAQIP